MGLFHVAVLALIAVFLSREVAYASQVSSEFINRNREYFLRSERSSHFVWRRRNDLPEPRSDFAVVRDDAANLIYLVSGCKGKNTPAGCSELTAGIWRYDPVKDEYTSIAPLATARYRHGAGLIGEELVVFGGLTTGELSLSTIEVYNIKTGATRTVPAGPLTSISDAAYFQHNGHVYAVAGYLVPDYIAQRAIYEMRTVAGGFAKVADLFDTRGDAFVTTVGNTAYMVGGYTNDNNWAGPLGTMESLDLITKAVTKETSDHLVPGRGDAAFCAMRGRLFVFGGESPSGVALDEVEVLSLDHRSAESRDWNYAGELPTERFRFRCMSTDFNSIHVFGGQEIADGPGSGNASTISRVDEFVEVRIFENLDMLLPTPLFITGTYSVAPWILTSAHMVEAMSRSPLRITQKMIPSANVALEFGVESPQDNLYIGGSALPKSVYDSIRARGHGIVQIPLTVSAVRIVMNLNTNEPVRLDACALARIFSGRSLNWRDVAGSAMPNVAVRAHRHSNTSSITIALVSYLQTACPSDFSLDGFAALPESSTRMAVFLQEGSVGYTTRAQYLPGHPYKHALVMNAAGNYSDPDTADLQTAFPASLNAVDVDLSSLSFNNAPGIRAYPIIEPTFAYVRLDQTSIAQQGPLLKAFLNFLLSPRGQIVAASFGHATLTRYLHGIATAAIASIRTAADSIEYALDAPSPEPEFSLSSGREDRLAYDMFAINAQQAQLQTLVNQALANRDGVQSNAVNITNTNNVAIAGLVIACFGFLLALYAALKARNMGAAAPAINYPATNGKAATQPRAAARYSNQAPGIGEDHIQVV